MFTHLISKISAKPDLNSACSRGGRKQSLSWKKLDIYRVNIHLYVYSQVHDMDRIGISWQEGCNDFNKNLQYK